jgi:hypothetical protein
MRAVRKDRAANVTIWRADLVQYLKSLDTNCKVEIPLRPYTNCKVKKIRPASTRTARLKIRLDTNCK